MGSCNSKKKDEILIFLGSNSQHSIHKALMNFMIKLEIFSSTSLHLNIPDLQELPFFNKDLILENKIPVKVEELCRSVSKAKSIIILTPEYNGATSADLINSIQWINQLHKYKLNNKKPFHKKLVGMISCSYISKRQIDDVKIMINESQPTFFQDVFYVDLKNGEIDPETKYISPKIKAQLSEWINQFMKIQ